MSSAAYLCLFLFQYLFYCLRTNRRKPVNNYFTKKLQNMSFLSNQRLFQTLTVLSYFSLWVSSIWWDYGSHPLEIHEGINGCWNSVEYLCWVAPRSRHSASTFHLAFWTRDRTKHTLLEAQIFILWFSPFSTCMQGTTPTMRVKNSCRLRF